MSPVKSRVAPQNLSTSTQIVARASHALETLDDLALEIGREHALAVASGKNCVNHALAAGRLLHRAKDQCPHGQWDPWLTKHFDGSRRTAYNYMMASAKCATVAHVEDLHLTLRELYAPDPKPKADTSTAVGRLTAAVQDTPKASSVKSPHDPFNEPDYVDATVVEDDPEPAGNLPAHLEKLWSAALDEAVKIRALVIEAGGPITPQSAAEALTDAAVKARQLSSQLNDLAAELRKTA